MSKGQPISFAFLRCSYYRKRGRTTSKLSNLMQELAHCALKEKRRNAPSLYLFGRTWRVSQVGQDGGPSSLRQEFEPPTRYQ